MSFADSHLRLALRDLRALGLLHSRTERSWIAEARLQALRACDSLDPIEHRAALLALEQAGVLRAEGASWEQKGVAQDALRALDDYVPARPFPLFCNSCGSPEQSLPLSRQCSLCTYLLEQKLREEPGRTVGRTFPERKPLPPVTQAQVQRDLALPSEFTRLFEGLFREGAR